MLDFLLIRCYIILAVKPTCSILRNRADSPKGGVYDE